MKAVQEKTTYNIAEFRANLSELLKRASAGEEIVIAKAGKPIVKLVAIELPKYRELGNLAHLVSDEQIEKAIKAVSYDPNEEYDYSEFYEDNLGFDIEG